MRLFSYKMKNDTGFAPNPFHGFCTLATCKPRMRLHKRPGDWIAGFTSFKLNGDALGEERVVFVMLVAEKLPLRMYYRDDRFRLKIPSRGGGRLAAMGDNIYNWHGDSYLQVPNISHGPENFAKDTGGENVLIASRFAYFGSSPLAIPQNLRPLLPKGQSPDGARTKDVTLAQAFIEFVISSGVGLHAAPTIWKIGDDSWRLEHR